MTWGLTAVAGATLVGGYMASQSASDAASTAAGAQTAASNASIEESRRQFDKIQELLKPYADVGPLALGQQKNLIGLGGSDAQKQAIAGISSGPEMQALTQQGENALLQNASATGGLRGGNLQAALAQFRPRMLSQLIQQQYTNLGGLTTLGQNAATGVGAAGQTSSGQIINALQQTGAANAGAAIAGGQAQAGMWNNVSGTASMLGTLKLLGKF
jgi:hypothetical protein